MAPENRWKLSLADLAVLVVGFAFSAASLRQTLAADPPATAIKIRKEWRCAAATSLFLSPLTWAAAGLAMMRTDRRRWMDHSAVVLGLSTFVLAIVEAAFTLSSGMWGVGSVSF